MGQKRVFSRVKAEDIKDRETAIKALCSMSEDTYRRTKGKVLSILEGLSLEKNTEELNSKMLIGYLKSISNGQFDIINTILEQMLTEEEKKIYIKRYEK